MGSMKIFVCVAGRCAGGSYVVNSLRGALLLGYCTVLFFLFFPPMLTGSVWLVGPPMLGQPRACVDWLRFILCSVVCVVLCSREQSSVLRAPLFRLLSFVRARCLLTDSSRMFLLFFLAFRCWVTSKARDSLLCSSIVYAIFSLQCQGMMPLDNDRHDRPEVYPALCRPPRQNRCAIRPCHRPVLRDRGLAANVSFHAAPVPRIALESRRTMNGANAWRG